MSARGYLVAGGFGALLATMVAIYVGAWPDSGGVAGQRPDRGRSLTRAIQMAEDQRRLAAETCAEKKWDACEAALDEAARLDAAGDREADVAALRGAIAAGRVAIGGANGGGALRAPAP